MAHGGARPGAGRKKGSRNRKQVDWNGPLVVDPSALAPDRDALSGMTLKDLETCSPLTFLTHIYRNRGLAAAIRADAAKAALPYAHARLAAPREDQPALPGLDNGWGDDLPPMNRRN
ncbi:hypothetical protein [Swaminathania salitolerans]|uniref:Uncharacterized protein n=1 Tax=Swaminathania salitolerans TaxID=182838 RepID=A0A511BNI0_9PROT|nr:hypothetical protein [Swaminathania salitolerans]GBQ14768.1 hypothetical protein AA21291_1950 [Swaminathania salitolerans LMG 21291]GEL01881.1 hypothetical protein SSA02_10440 [Swaminathania salitolerans]